MAICEQDILITNDYLTFLRWNALDENQNRLNRLTFRLYNAVKHLNENDLPVWEGIYEYRDVKSIIDFGRKINISHLTNQPLILTVQEDCGVEKILHRKIGRPYEVKIQYNHRLIGPVPARRSVLEVMLGKKEKRQKKEEVVEIYVPKMPDNDTIPRNLLYCSLKCDNGRIYEMHLPNLQEGWNIYYRNRIESRGIQIGSFNIREDLKNMFIIV